jgi:hypothetical protein
MQNKANLLDTQINASYVKTKNYEQKTMEEEPIKQTQTKPIERRQVLGPNAKNRLPRKTRNDGGLNVFDGGWWFGGQIVEAAVDAFYIYNSLADAV